MLKGNGKSYRRAKQARRDLTLPEGLLWRELRGRKGDKWRKQHPAGPYILDFYCDRAKLCVEVDGEAHEYGDRPERDARRDAWLAVQGIATLRIPASEVLNNLSGVLTHIHRVAAERQNSSPTGGGGSAQRGRRGRPEEGGATTKRFRRLRGGPSTTALRRSPSPSKLGEE